MAYQIQLKQFEGPLDLLLHLISRAKVDICDIFVSEITEQYLASMEDITSLDMDVASEFLAMVAMLLEIKARALLPRPPKPEEEGEETPEQALIRRLSEYRALKEGVGELQAFERAALRMFDKLPEEYPLPPPTWELTNLTLEGLLKAYRRVLDRVHEQPERLEAVRQIRRDAYSVEECMHAIAHMLKRGPCRFEALFSAQPTRVEVVTLFLAMLEMLKLGRIHIEQTETFGEITLSPGRKQTHDAT